MNKKPTGYGKIFSLRKADSKPKVEQDFDEKHTKVMQAILPYAKKTQQKNLTIVDIDYVTRKTKVCFFLLPEWAKMFPPYNLARLVAICKNAGYETNAFDINARASNEFQSWGVDYDPWNSAREWKWIGETYHNELHHHMLPIIDRYLEKIEELKPDVIGFSLYYCNEEPTNYMVKEIKKRWPHIIILAGGPQCHQSYWEPIPEFDYVVTGEGEKILLEILEEIENGKKHDKQVWIRQQEGERLNLDLLPLPDYSHFDFRDYGMPNGVNSELSRGCIAKCVFCSETHFWKYRGRMATSIIDEVAKLYYDHGVDFIWFLDSLVNGNLNELRAFAKGVVARDLNIHWTGYARCDGRMDLEFYKDLAQSGCISMTYGVESGSDKVLRDMDKGVTVAEMEQNFRDGKTVGIEAFTNWIIGFPTEEPQDFYESMLLLYRNRNNNITDVAGGHGFTIPPDTIVGQGPEFYGIGSQYYLGNWIRKDFKSTKLHRHVRVKSFNILLHYMVTVLGMDSGGNRPTTGNFYTLQRKSQGPVNEIEFEKFDFNIIQQNINPMADTLINEIWPLLRILYRALGAYDIHIVFDPIKDKNEFSDRLVGNYKADYKFSIDENGKYVADFICKFIQGDGAWSYTDFTRAESLAAQRARILANPDGSGQSLWSMDRYRTSMEELNNLQSVDFSFDVRYYNLGQW